MNNIEALIGLCESIDFEEADAVVNTALLLSERSGVSEEIRSLAIDAMLIANHDFEGEFKSKEQLLAAVRALRTQS